MEEGKSSRAHPHFVLGSSPFRIPFPAPCAPRFIGFTNSNQWFPEEGGENLASETKGMILGLIGSVHVVDLRRQNDLRHIIMWFDVFYAMKCTESCAHLRQTI